MEELIIDNLKHVPKSPIRSLLHTSFLNVYDKRDICRNLYNDISAKLKYEMLQYLIRRRKIFRIKMEVDLIRIIKYINKLEYADSESFDDEHSFIEYKWNEFLTKRKIFSSCVTYSGDLLEYLVRHNYYKPFIQLIFTNAFAERQIANAFLTACDHRNKKIIISILESYNITPNLFNGQGIKSIAKSNYIDIMDILILYGGSLIYNESPLTIAVRANKTRMVKFILQYSNYDIKNAYDTAEREKNIEMMNILFNELYLTCSIHQLIDESDYDSDEYMNTDEDYDELSEGEIGNFTFENN